MVGFLFEQIIFGPVRSRRLGISLGVNLLPLNHKHCTFNCLYCECGWTEPRSKGCTDLPGRVEVKEALEARLKTMAARHDLLTTITFAGNGEPTLHPEFEAIIEDTLKLRNSYFPSAKIAVLSNASLADDDSLIRALTLVDMNILKLDAGTEETFRMINNPGINISLKQVVENLKRFNGNMIIQTLFVKGSIHGKPFDNTSEKEVKAWLAHLEMLRPQAVMIYPVARAAPIEDVQKIPYEKLQEIAQRVENLGIEAEVY